MYISESSRCESDHQALQDHQITGICSGLGGLISSIVMLVFLWPKVKVMNLWMCGYTNTWLTTIGCTNISGCILSGLHHLLHWTKGTTWKEETISGQPTKSPPHFLFTNKDIVLVLTKLHCFCIFFLRDLRALGNFYSVALGMLKLLRATVVTLSWVNIHKVQLNTALWLICVSSQKTWTESIQHVYRCSLPAPSKKRIP